MDAKSLLLVLLVTACAPQQGSAFLDVLLKDDMVQLFLGTSTPFYLVEQGYDSQLARSGILQYLDPLSADKSQLTFEWSSKKPIHYVIQLNSGNKGMMEDPRADISLRGTVPNVETEFHVNFPCTHQTSGTTFVAITFTFFDGNGSPMYRMPFTLAMKRQCIQEQTKKDLKAHKVDVSNLSDKDKETLPGHTLGKDDSASQPAPIAVVVQPRGRPATVKPAPPVNPPKDTKDADLASTPAPQTRAPKPPQVTKPVVVAPAEPHVEACPMCVMPKNISQLRDYICKAGFAIRTRLTSKGRDKTTNHFYLGLRDYRELRQSRRSASSALYAWEQHSRHADASEKASLTTNAPMAVRVMVGSRGTCSCNGRVNNRDLYLLAGKYSNRRGQLVIRQTKSLLLPWREVKHWIRALRPFTCSK